MQENKITLFGLPVNNPKILIHLIQIVVLLWLLSWILLYWYAPTPEQRGQFGDMFGALNALFTGLTFAGLFYTILLQRQQMIQQRDEINLTRETLSIAKEDLAATKDDLERSNKQFEIQNATLQLQSFESTFFNLLQSQNEIIKLLELKDKNGNSIARGKDCFKIFKEFLDQKIRDFKPTHFEGPPPKYIPFKTRLPTVDYSDFIRDLFTEYEQYLGHYFRHLYNIIKFVHESNITNKKRYIGFFRATFSSYEHLILFYKYLSGLPSKPKIKFFVEEYSLFKNLNQALLYDKVHKDYFSPSAFGVDEEKEY
jgi:hypothetical protein